MKTLSDAQLREYFLGKLPEPEAEILEEECALSEELTGRAELVERELADDYLRGNLSPADADLFETNYLITEPRRKKLRVAQGLWLIAGARKKAENLSVPAPQGSFWQSVFSRRYRFQTAFAGLFLLLVFGCALFYLLAPGVDKNEIAEVKDAAEPAPKIENPVVQKDAAENQNPKISAVNSAPLAKEANKNSAATQKNQPEPKPVAPPKSTVQNLPGLATFVLLPGTLRDEGEQFITIAPNLKNINLSLKLPDEAIKYRNYRAVLKTADGAEILTAPVAGKSLALPVPAEKLENRTYMVFLEGENSPPEFESIAEYTFRVAR